MVTPLGDLIAITLDNGADSATLAKALDRAREAATQAGDAHMAADDAYRDGLLGDEKVLAKLAAARAAAEVHRDRAAALVVRLETRHADTVLAEAETARRVIYDAAVTARDAAAARLLAEYRGLVGQLLDLLREAAEADVAVTLANNDLPAGLDKLATTESIARHVPGLPRQDISDTQVDLWCREGEVEPVSEDLQGSIVSKGDGTGYRSTSTGQHHFVRRRFRRVSYRPAIPAQHIERLAIGLALPPLRPDDPLTWRPEDWRTASPHVTVATLARIEEAVALPVEAAARPVAVEFVPMAALHLVKRIGEHVDDYQRRVLGHVKDRFEPIDVERNPDAADAA